MKKQTRQTSGSKQRRRIARVNIAREIQERTENPSLRLVADHKGQILTRAEIENLKENRDGPIQLRGNS